jgi:hypothetical protein
MKAIQTLGLLAFLAVPGLLSAETFKCEFEANRVNGGWIPDIVVVDYDAARQSVMVNDPLIVYFVGQPITGKVAVDNAARLTVTWQLKATVDAANQLANMNYRLTYLKADKIASISGQALGYAGPYTAQGRCGPAG